MFLKCFSWDIFWYKYDLFDYIILLIFLKQCDFLKLTMQCFKSDKNSFLNEYLFSYWALAHSVFKINFSARFVCEISGNGWCSGEMRFLYAGWRVTCSVVSNVLVCKPWFEVTFYICMKMYVDCIRYSDS